jgi:DNA mismatch repair protein MSH2
MSAPQIDESLDAFEAYYTSLPLEHNTIRIYDRKTCYSIHGAHAELIARQIYRSTAAVTRVGGRADGLLSIAFPPTLFPTLLRDLLLESGQHNVELYEGSGSSWKCIKKGSPGLWSDFEPDLARSGDISDVPIVVAISLSPSTTEVTRTVGIAYLNPSSRVIGACEFADDEHFCQLETALVQLGARECVLSSSTSTGTKTKAAGDGEGTAATAEVSTITSTNTIDIKRLERVVSQCGALLSRRPKSTFKTNGLDQDLGRLLKTNTAANGSADENNTAAAAAAAAAAPSSLSPVEQHRALLERPQAAAAIAGLLSFSEITSDPSAHGRFTLSYYNTGHAMRLDSAAQRALNVIKGSGDTASTFSLYGIMNRGKTAMGKRLLRAWLKQPLVNVDDIDARLDIVEALLSDTALRSDLQQLHLRGLPDIERLTRKLEKSQQGRGGGGGGGGGGGAAAAAATLADLCQLYRTSSRLPLIEEALRKHEGPGSDLLISKFCDPLKKAHDADHLLKFEELLEAAVDLDRVPDEYLIAASYDPGLEEIQIEKEQVEDEINKLAAEAADDLSLVLDKSIKLEWHKASHQRLRCLRITAKEEKVVRKKLQARYMELETRKDGMKFTNKPLKAAADELQRLSGQYDSRQADLVAQVVNVASTFSEIWETVSALLAELDILVGFADLAACAPKPYCRPLMLPPDDGQLVLKGCRHPCVEAQDSVDFIPNDCVMEKGKSWFQIITGPNMGGKSTYIRQVGMAVLMAQVGCFVPCDEATIAVRDAIFARVGAGDCQLRGVSTFMAEMLETSAIIKGASSRSLVIIDELGRGTSTWDGLGLAWAISEHLMSSSIGCATLFATHFHELTALQGPTGVKNLHVKTAIDQSSGALTMLYQVHEGSCDQSFGIHVAEFAKFPQEVIDAARKNAAELENFNNSSGGSDGGSGGGEKRKRLDVAEVKAALEEYKVLTAGGDGGGDGGDIKDDGGERRKKLEAWLEKASLLVPTPEAKRPAAVV